MINYRDYEKQVYNWLMQKHDANSNRYGKRGCGELLDYGVINGEQIATSCVLAMT